MSQHEKLEIQNIASVLEIGMWKNPDSQITKSALLFLNKQLYEWFLSFFLFQITFLIFLYSFYVVKLALSSLQGKIKFWQNNYLYSQQLCF